MTLICKGLCVYSNSLIFVTIKISLCFINIHGHFFQIEWILFKPSKLFTDNHVFKPNQLFACYVYKC